MQHIEIAFFMVFVYCSGFVGLSQRNLSKIHIMSKISFPNAYGVTKPIQGYIFRRSFNLQCIFSELLDFFGFCETSQVFGL